MELTLNSGTAVPTDQPVNTSLSTNVIEPDVMAIENNMAIITTLPAVLRQHNIRVTTAEAVGDKLLAALEKNGGVMNAEIDEMFKTFIIKANKAVEEMEAARKPGTQSFDLIRNFFTKWEKRLDNKTPGTITYKMQLHRNDFARQEALRIENEKKEAERIANVGKEEVTIRASIVSQIGSSLINYLGSWKASIQKHFDSLTLETFADKTASLKLMDVDFPEEKINDIVKVGLPPLIYHTAEQATAFLNQEWKAYDFTSFKAQYKAEIQDLKTSLIAQIPAKKAQLIQIKEANQADAERLLQEQKTREENQRKFQEEQLQIQLEKNREAAKQMETSGHVQTLFTAGSTVTPSGAAESKTDVEITVNNHAGIVEVFTLWFTEYAKDYSVEDLLKKTVKQMVGDLQKLAKKDGKKITGTNVTYGTKVTAVNKATKPG